MTEKLQKLAKWKNVWLNNNKNMRKKNQNKNDCNYISTSFCISLIYFFFFFLLFLNSVRCLIVTLCRYTKATLWRRSLTDDLDLASVHRHWERGSSVGPICVVAAQLSQTFGCLPSQSSSAGEGQMSSPRYTVHPCAQPLTPPLSLSLSDGACLLHFITYSLIFQRHSHTFITGLDLIKDDLPHLFLTR